MKTLIGAVTSVRAQILVGAALLACLVLLLVMSNHTGQREFRELKQALDELETQNIRMDGSIFLLAFEMHTDFDVLTAQQKDLRETALALASILPDGERAILAPAERKLLMVEDFKSEQSILRNSRAIAHEMIERLWTGPGVDSPATRDALFAVERAFLDFLARRDPKAANRLRAVLENPAVGSAVTDLEEWDVLRAHSLNLIDYIDRLTRLMQSPPFIELPVAIFEQNARLTARLAETSAAASRYRSALFVVALLLLAFSAVMVARVRGYLQAIARANNDLESRVARRTQELADVNAALRREIAERESVESQLRIAQKLESIGQLAAGVAHEINTPTQYVSDNVSFLSAVWKDLTPVLEDYERIALRGEADPARSRRIWSEADVPFLSKEVPAALRQSSAGLQQITRIVLAMKNFSHPGSDALQPADLNRAIESTATVARNEWKYVAELTLDLDPDLPLVPCNVSAFNQVVLNLLINAAQAVEEARPKGELGHIRVATRTRAECVEISVEDDGPGIADAIRDRIFDPFFTTKEVGKGTGQGLAISHRVIHGQHGGTLSVEPAPQGRGARFVIRLPQGRLEERGACPALTAADAM
ncbi:MAG: hypothetical protein JXB36_00385 [Gammaproteobacteria bacterium]|nr:hypothetical protein [Gammaproteobacteria bacterium]